MNKLYTFFTILLLSTSSYAAIGWTEADRVGRDIPLDNAKTVADVAKYIKDNLDTPANQARAAAVFIVYQMDKNGYAERRIKESATRNQPIDSFIVNDPLSTRVGTSGDYADLYQQICREMEIETVTIPGYAGRKIPYSRYVDDPTAWAIDMTRRGFGAEPATDYTLQRYRSSWNAVKIDGDWRLVDTYWMTFGDDYFGVSIRNDRDMENALNRRAERLPSVSDLKRGKKIDNSFFFAEPGYFAKTHYPLEEKWQLLDTPVTWRKFTR